MMWKPVVLTFDLTLTWPLTSFCKIFGVLKICLVESFRLPFSRISTTIRSGVRQGGQNLPPPPAGRVRPNTPAGRGLKKRVNYEGTFENLKHGVVMILPGLFCKFLSSLNTLTENKWKCELRWCVVIYGQICAMCVILCDYYYVERACSSAPLSDMFVIATPTTFLNLSIPHEFSPPMDSDSCKMQEFCCLGFRLHWTIYYLGKK